MSKLSTSPSKASSRNLIIALAVTVTIAAIGYIVVATHAAGPFALVDLSASTPTAPAQIVADPNTSSGKAVQFGTGTTTTPPDSGSATCPLPAYPNQSCTGVPANTKFTKTEGTYFATTAGEVIDSVHITGDLVIEAANVTVKNSQIDGHVDNEPAPSSSFTINDSSVGAIKGSYDVKTNCSTEGWPSINGHDFTANRVFLGGHQDGVDVVGNNVTVNDSVIQPCYQPPEVVGSDGFHTDGMQDQCSSTCSNITLSHNTIDARAFYKDPKTGVISSMGNSVLNLGSVADGKHAANVILRDNLFMGGGYSTDLQYDGMGNKWVVTNNSWVQDAWAYAPISTEGTCSNQTWSGNRIVTIDTNFAVTSTVRTTDCVN